MIPADATQSRLTVEYTDNPAWLMVQSLPTLGMPSDDNAISLAAAWYANGLGRYIVQQQPEAKKAFTLWKQEGAEGTSLVSQLEQNQELKDVVLNETPWPAATLRRFVVVVAWYVRFLLYDGGRL